jgi:3alpha(or 20beta)-hydroxysteroid dehydrogenase
LNEYVYPVGTRLDGKVALVTGGARGLGEAIVRAMVAQGGQVVIADVRDEECDRLAASLGASTFAIHLDVADRANWAAGVASTVARFGKLNVLVNNAGIAGFAVVGEYASDLWDRTIAINLTGAFNGISASVDALRAGAPASIINISSTAGLYGIPKGVGYSASKFGLRGLTKTVALDLGRDGIRCNSIHPGRTITPLTQSLGHAADDKRRDLALGRNGEPHEVAMMTVFLASDESSYSTGAEFVVDGGSAAGIAAD